MKELGINQPSLSKRLKYLQHAGPLLDRPWLVRNGKTWELTDEGRRVWPAVAELVDRYDNLETFLDGDRSIAVVCAVFVRPVDGRRSGAGGAAAVSAGASANSGCGSRLCGSGADRGRIERLAGSGDREPRRTVDRRDCPAALACGAVGITWLGPGLRQDSPWIRAVRGLPKDAVPARALTEFPLIVPEPDAGIRKEIDRGSPSGGTAKQLNIVLEVGGWATILAYVRDGFGVGVVSEGAVQ